MILRTLQSTVKQLRNSRSGLEAEHIPRTRHVSTPDAQFARHHAPRQPSAREKLNDHSRNALIAQQLGPHLSLRLAVVARHDDLLDRLSAGVLVSVHHAAPPGWAITPNGITIRCSTVELVAPTWSGPACDGPLQSETGDQQEGKPPAIERANTELREVVDAERDLPSLINTPPECLWIGFWPAA